MEKRTKRQNKITTPVFWASLFLSLAIVLLAAFSSEGFQGVTAHVCEVISCNFSWYYLLLVTAIVVVCLFLAISPIGQIRLGDPDSRPEHSNLSWFAMLFSAGMGIGLVFWGAAEPLSHYAISSPSAPVGTNAALADSFTRTFFHWGIHAWAIYAIVALALAYFKFRKKEKSLLSVTLKPFLGNKTEGWIGKVIDTITIFAIVVGIATTLGFGVAQINGGLNYLFDTPLCFSVQAIIVTITTILFIASALSGLGKGLKLLSNINIILALALLGIALVVGPTVSILNTFVDSLGSYIQGFFGMSLGLGAIDQVKHSWVEDWTVFYWVWWIAWAPSVGVFIARISKGRTIREFLICVLIIPSILSFLWFSTFGTMSTAIQSSGLFDLKNLGVEQVLFGTLAQYPLGGLMCGLALLLILFFFVTSADSATFVLGMLSENGNLNPHKRTKAIWGVFVAAVSLALLAAGGLDALQNILIIVALPFSAIMLVMMFALIKELNHERQAMGLVLKPAVIPEKDHPFKSYERKVRIPNLSVWASAEEGEEEFSIPLYTRKKENPFVVKPFKIPKRKAYIQAKSNIHKHMGAVADSYCSCEAFVRSNNRA